MEFWILPDKIFVSLLALVDNQLSVIQHKATEQKQTTIQLKLLRKYNAQALHSPLSCASVLSMTINCSKTQLIVLHLSINSLVMAK